MKRNRLFDVATVEKLSNLHAHALDHGLCLNIDFSASREPKSAWIVQLYDHAERLVVSAWGRTPEEVVAQVQERWLAKNPSVR